MLTIDPSWTLFLDRDGVINYRNFDGYVTTPSEFEFLPGALSGIVRLSALFQRIIVVTNQQCIAKKIASKRNVEEVHRYMLAKIEEAGGKIDAVFVADNLKGAMKDRRKPNPAMAMEAKTMFPDLDFNKSVMVGDTNTDIQFGANLGMKTVLIPSKELVTEKADLIVEHLLQLSDLIKVSR